MPCDGSRAPRRRDFLIASGLASLVRLDLGTLVSALLSGASIMALAIAGVSLGCLPSTAFLVSSAAVSTGASTGIRKLASSAVRPDLASFSFFTTSLYFLAVVTRGFAFVGCGGFTVSIAVCNCCACVSTTSRGTAGTLSNAPVAKAAATFCTSDTVIESSEALRFRLSTTAGSWLGTVGLDGNNISAIWARCLLYSVSGVTTAGEVPCLEASMASSCALALPRVETPPLARSFSDLTRFSPDSLTLGLAATKSSCTRFIACIKSASDIGTGAVCAVALGGVTSSLVTCCGLAATVGVASVGCVPCLEASRASSCDLALPRVLPLPLVKSLSDLTRFSPDNLTLGFAATKSSWTRFSDCIKSASGIGLGAVLGVVDVAVSAASTGGL